MGDKLKAPAPDKATVEGWQELMTSLRSGHLSDFTIRCGDDRHLVHKNILSLQSKFFDRVCTGPFKEASKGILNLPEDDPLAVRAMVDCIYLGNYTQTIMKPSRDESEKSPKQPPKKKSKKDNDNIAGFLPLHAKVYVLGDKYELPTVRATATRNIAGILENDPDCVLDEKFRNTLDIVYNYTRPDATDVRGCLVEALARHDSSLDSLETNAKILEHASLSYELYIRLKELFKMTKGINLMCSKASCFAEFSTSRVPFDASVMSTRCPTSGTGYGHAWIEKK